ncbi:aryl-alcohol dehydrogenase-like predicted oxidoreductase [Kribbella voronezhensis]|uniref:Aryl-alcohol dehydrogenase-like predicted oxidoreductase n=1 Tax=Kribbella voronezhensis TaxID=2512212 RepID=A0A4R7T6I1_9ACTN|nr:aldo/keto reductase [Kribbella voronezhensis]TDU87454.1 aryl-alcohol dehydrogenase-like predicted oxidoreductase [Kribbella voronezhensis]
MRESQLGELTVSSLGLGCMGMSQSYGVSNDDAESIATVHAALDAGCTFIDTADVYGNGANEELVGRALAGRRDEAILATKFGFQWSSGNSTLPTVVNGKPEYARAALDASLQRLGVDYVDLWYLHRRDPEVPIEETVGAMAEAVQAGKVRYLGLSEVSGETVRAAHAVHPISAVQSEWSLWTRDPETVVLPTLRELGIGFVPFSPLGRGFLTGQLKSPDDFEPDDMRRGLPRFSGENFQRNLDLVEKVRSLAAAKGVTAGQLALAWLLAQGNDIAPIPGTKRRKYLAENLGAIDVTLSAEELAALDEAFPPDAVAGDRYSEAAMKAVER